MEQSEFRVLIKHYYLRGKTAKETKEKLDKCYGNSAPSNTTVKRWMQEFKFGRTSTNDEPRSGRPLGVTSPEMIARIEKLVTGDRKLKLRELADMVSISSERVYNILHNHLNMLKLCTRWVPRVITNDQKRERVECSEANLSMIKRNRSEFFRRLIIVDETWIHHYTPETAQQSKQWVSKGQSAPKRPKSQQSAGKVMATVFWDARGIIHVDHLEHGRTITAQYYSDLLDRFDAVVKRKRPHLKKKKILFLQDNAPAHKAVKTMTKLIELGYEILPHPPVFARFSPL